MAVLAFSSDEVIGSRRLAASVNTNPVVVRRLLLSLRAARLVETLAGRHGGARLGKNPSRISLMKIYDAVEPRPVISVNGRKALKRCHGSCNMKHVMSCVADSTERAVRKHLRGITLAQLLRRINTPR